MASLTQEQREAETEILKEVMQKLEEAWRLARELEAQLQCLFELAHHFLERRGFGFALLLR